jgi:hypothetical protein
MHETLSVWELEREVAPDIAARVALEKLEPPDIEVVLLSTRGDVITVQVVDGSLSDPESVLYVARRGLYELVRSEEWPAVEGGGPRVLLTLRAWPNA